MATIITSECINCGACEPECPNASIYQGGAEWELNGAKHEPIAADIFYIVPEKCTECVGFHDKEACAVVCPVDCCIPDPDRPESEAVLLERAKSLHPDRVFTEDFPSRFRKPGVTATASEPQPSPPAPSPKPVAPVSAAAEAPPPPAPEKTPVAAETRPAATAEPPPPAPAADKPAPPAAAKPAAAASEGKGPAARPAVPASAPAPAATAQASEAKPAVDEKPQKEGALALPDMDEWEIPVECFRCHASYAVVFKHFRTGAVLYCPSCKGSYVVTSTMHSQVHRLLREFYDQWRPELEAAREKLGSAAFEERRRRAVEQFDTSLKALRAQQRAPGAPRKRAWIFG
jgi:ferredoxin/uncharacterized Zn finger protein (UPF0148 family)